MRAHPTQPLACDHAPRLTVSDLRLLDSPVHSACFLAARAESPLAGLLLQSPLLSGANALLGPGVATLGGCLDIFKNYQHIKDARCRVAVCHGTNDMVVPCWNGRKLLTLAAETHEPQWQHG